MAAQTQPVLVTNPTAGGVAAHLHSPNADDPRNLAGRGGPLLSWLFVDLNSYFASVEQQTRPELRGKPVGILPMMAETTCCIAASYEAKAFGVKTGTSVADARRLCPEIRFVEARHEIYVEYHHKIVAAVEHCLPVTGVYSIDEMGCRLIGRERPLMAAMELGRQIKRRIQSEVGDTLRCSVGLATNRYLAKIATDMDKPDGLIALTPDILRGALLRLELRDLPGIGPRMEKRLNEAGIRTMEHLLELSAEQCGHAWGSVWGERLWHWLRGEDFEMGEVEHPKSVGHQHVLSPEMRTPERAWSVAHKLLHKAAIRLRSGGLWASRISMAASFQPPEETEADTRPEGAGEGAVAGQAGGVKSGGGFRWGPPPNLYNRPGRRSWSAEMRLSECQDSDSLIHALRRLWDSRPRGPAYEKPYFIGVQLSELVPDPVHTLNLFSELDGEVRRRRLSEAMDELNGRYGLATVAPAAMLAATQKDAAPTRIAFSSVPDLF